MQILFGPYPMTVRQMNEWARTVSTYTPTECAKALQFIDNPLTIRRVK